MPEARPITRLMVSIETAPGALERLAAAFGAASIVGVILRPESGRPDRALLADLVEAARSRGSTVLIVDDVELVRALKADGLHLTANGNIEARYREARNVLGRDFTIGVDVSGSRHVAMTTAENGADYVAFGYLPTENVEQDWRADRRELVAWWAEVFEPPCVALEVSDPGEAASLAQIGADFIAVSISAGTSPSEIHTTCRAIADALATQTSLQVEPGMRT